MKWVIDIDKTIKHAHLSNIEAHEVWDKFEKIVEGTVEVVIFNDVTGEVIGGHDDVLTHKKIVVNYSYWSTD